MAYRLILLKEKKLLIIQLIITNALKHNEITIKEHEVKLPNDHTDLDLVDLKLQMEMNWGFRFELYYVIWHLSHPLVPILGDQQHPL